MNAHRIGTVRKIEARLKAYDEAIKEGKTREEAMVIARKITNKKAREAGR